MAIRTVTDAIRYVGADDATKTAVWEVYKFIHVNTVAPFGTVRTKIRKRKKAAL